MKGTLNTPKVMICPESRVPRMSLLRSHKWKDSWNRPLPALSTSQLVFYHLKNKCYIVPWIDVYDGTLQCVISRLGLLLENVNFC